MLIVLPVVFCVVPPRLYFPFSFYLFGPLFWSYYWLGVRLVPKSKFWQLRCAPVCDVFLILFLIFIRDRNIVLSAPHNLVLSLTASGFDISVDVLNLITIIHVFCSFVVRISAVLRFC